MVSCLLWHCVPVYAALCKVTPLRRWQLRSWKYKAQAASCLEDTSNAALAPFISFSNRAHQAKEGISGTLVKNVHTIYALPNLQYLHIWSHGEHYCGIQLQRTPGIPKHSSTSRREVIRVKIVRWNFFIHYTVLPRKLSRRNSTTGQHNSECMYIRSGWNSLLSCSGAVCQCM